jgi:hypothetical protein
MPTICTATGCKCEVPSALDAEKVCVFHFTLAVERCCSEMRRETALGNAPRERQVEIIRYIAERGELLARATTSGLHLTDELKARA